MLGEVLAAVIVGVLALWLVLQPLLRPSAPPSLPLEPIDPEETPQGIALTALKEIEFDRETLRLDAGAAPRGAVSDDVEAMIAARVRALRSASAPPPSDTHANAGPGQVCRTCGQRPEPDAVFCSTCGRRLPTRSACDRCGAALLPDSRFCEACGRQVAA